MVETLLTFYLLLGSGYLLKRLGVFKTEDTAVFVNFVVYFALPLTVFAVFKDLELSADLAAVVAVAWTSAAVSTLVSFFLFSKLVADRASLKSLFLSATFGNTAFAGYPIAYSLFGEEGLAYAIVYDVVGNFLLVVTLAVALIGQRPDWRLFYRFPPAGALLAAFALKGASLEPLKGFFAAAKASLVPTVVFALGLRFEPRAALKNLPLALLAVLWRQLVSPLLVLLLLLLLKEPLRLSHEAAAVALLQSSMPPFVMAVILSEKYRLNPDLSLAAANLGLLLLPLTVPLWLKVSEVLFG
ncbi:MAG: AEC family transporter [Aquificae bacterium]|nr:AEC family transporter [Aquificota bacterium]